jgi:hypothetical protein
LRYHHLSFLTAISFDLDMEEDTSSSFRSRRGLRQHHRYKAGKADSHLRLPCYLHLMPKETGAWEGEVNTHHFRRPFVFVLLYMRLLKKRLQKN